MKRKIHATAAFLSFFLVASFWASTVVSELFMTKQAVTYVKEAIVLALFIFVPTIAITGVTGFSMGGKGRNPLLASKRRRMPLIAGTGLLLLLPAAVFLYFRSQAGLFDQTFYWVQGLELLAGASNLTLIGLNIRDGLHLSKNRKSVVARHFERKAQP
ncbi:hypothetical protein [Pseudomonas sp. PGPR40]|uniref:hypothetical protein n=1 Tax=Pseudomonas sp. PGPR40 TaxID=2913476 RepID=UPI001EDC320D|nr:hypothetical protein [Pseudomonas sp. PGPR40]